MGKAIARKVRRLGATLAMALAIPALAMPAMGVSAWASQPWRYALDSTASDVRAQVAFLGLSNKTAQFPTVRGRVALSQHDREAIDLDVTIDARALRADDPTTLTRLKGPAFFDVARFPDVRFSGQSMRFTGDRTAEVRGALTARGVTRPETLRITFDRDPAQAAPGDPMRLTGRMVIDRRDYGMTAWSLVVGNKVDITLRTRMVPD